MSGKVQARRLPDTEAIRDMRIESAGDPRHDSALFLLSKPQSFERGPNTAITTDIIWISSMSEPDGGLKETAIFPAELSEENPSGFDVLSWNELPGSISGIADIDVALQSFLKELEERDG